MKTVNFAKVGFYVGAGIGVILFLVIWLLPVSYFTGQWGSRLFGNTHGVLVGILMVIGVLTAGAFFSFGGALTGWFVGVSIDSIKIRITTRIARITTRIAQLGKRRTNRRLTPLSEGGA